jgi:hypothetical protein
MKRSVLRNARIVLYAGLALSFVQGRTLAQLAKTENIPVYGNQGGHPGYHPGYPMGAGGHGQTNSLTDGDGYPPFGRRSGYTPVGGFGA